MNDEQWWQVLPELDPLDRLQVIEHEVSRERARLEQTREQLLHIEIALHETIALLKEAT